MIFISDLFIKSLEAIYSTKKSKFRISSILSSGAIELSLKSGLFLPSWPEHDCWDECDSWP
jgi:hypothetical protein